MRKYNITVQAELILEDYMDELDLHKFNKSRTIVKLTDEDEYKFYLALWNITIPEELATACINKITVTEITE